ncbi:unnamed protein product [Plutella xylostella]|uniref:(diamondback moth) hypothetical protein n=1 Tax=Plutella xylostella TaxID=51655 RepID=A0A8S4D7W9_PLUXY|nr:unnamed protein product [Plutella xylostella]
MEIHTENRHPPKPKASKHRAAACSPRHNATSINRIATEAQWTERCEPNTAEHSRQQRASSTCKRGPHSEFANDPEEFHLRGAGRGAGACLSAPRLLFKRRCAGAGRSVRLTIASAVSVPCVPETTDCRDRRRRPGAVSI